MSDRNVELHIAYTSTSTSSRIRIVAAISTARSAYATVIGCDYHSKSHEASIPSWSLSYQFSNYQIWTLWSHSKKFLIVRRVRPDLLTLTMRA
jgi:hypothetical protein